MYTAKTAPTVLPVSYEEMKEKRMSNAKGNGEIDQEAFLNLLVTQMRNQDPLEPMDNMDFTTQTTAFAQLEQMTNTNKGMDKMVELTNNVYQANQGLGISQGFIGKTVEYNTNTVKIDNGVPSPISFYAEEAGQSGTIKIINASDELVGMITMSEGVKKGQNDLPWDGKGLGNVDLQDGTYYFQATATTETGKDVGIATYSEGKVDGVTVTGGKMYFRVNNGLVPADSVYSVKEKAQLVP
jgi:flagellar basal-body rod modification protein FlgD